MDMSDSIDNFIHNVRAVIARSFDGNESAFARACNIGQRTLNRVLNKETDPRIETIEQIASPTGYSVAALFSPDLVDAGMDFTMVRRLDVKASAGNGNLVFLESDKSRLAFRRDFLSSMGLNESRAVIIYADGRSMEPTIHDGAVVLIDVGDTELKSDRIYAISIDDEVVIKRLRRDIGGGLIVVSDNPDKINYPDRAVPVDKLEYVHIKGRAVWMGARL